MDVLSNTDLETLRHGDIISFHLTPLPQLLKRFHTDDENGLTEERAQRSLEFQGTNTLKKTRQRSKILFFLKNFFGGFALLLWFSAALCFTAYFIISNQPMKGENAEEHLYVGVVLIVVVIITGIFTYIQSKKSSRLMDSFQNMMPRFTKVIRDGNKMVIPVEEVVLGDLVELNAGDQVPADLRIVKCAGLKVDNSCLTGESRPHALSTDALHENALEAKNLAFSSTLVVEGTGRGIVIACGENTQMGRIASLASGLEATETPLSKEIRRFVKIITCVSIFLGALFFILAIINLYKPLDAALFLIAIMVANVPEGLLVTVTMCLTLSAKRMAKKNCLVKHLEAVEALGSTSVICSDKTGTLTQNKMTVSHLWYGGSEKIVDTSFPERSVSGDDPLLIPLLRIAMLCNKAEFKVSEGQADEHVYQRKIIGDASECALLKFAEAVLGNEKSYRLRYPKILEIPFNSVNKYQLSIHEIEDTVYSHILVMKGAPERILDLCTKINTEGGAETMSRDMRKNVRNTFTAMAGYGERVLGFSELFLEKKEYPKGYKFNTKDPNFPLKRLVFVGLASMIDPPRPGVRNAVAMCRSAGIKVIMVTGDHPTTALAIARQVGIVSEGTETPEEMAQRLGIQLHHVDLEKAGALVVHGSELLTLSPRELDEILMTFNEIVFARTTPTQKLNIVEGCQRLGAIVAVTGDGVNDSPALKKANIGVAMGITGSDVAKQAADMVLLDDNFATIVLGIEEGRIIFDNLKKSIAYTLTSNTPEMLPFMFTLLYKVPLPLGVLAILCINVGTDLWPAISLAYESAESDIMKREPRDPKHDKLVNWRLISMAYLQIGMIQAAAGFFMYFCIMAENGFMPDRLMGILDSWHSMDVDDLEDSYGQEWNFENRRELEYLCHTGFFVAIVEVQWADVIICKTRRISIVEKKMNNFCLNAGLVFETAFAIFFVYTPYVNNALNLVPLAVYHWFLPLPFVAFILLFDEARRYWIRERPYSFVKKETYY